MPSYVCKIGTADGRIVEKDFDAVNKTVLKAGLEEQGFRVFTVRLRLFQALSGRRGGSRRFTGRSFLSFNQELVVLLKSGLPILQVLETVTERLESGRLLEVMREIQDDVKGGAILSEAFGKFPRFFPPLYIASFRAGEQTGELPVTLGRYIAYQHRAEKLKAKIKSASFYPAILVSFVVVVVLFLMLWVVPTFTQIYADSGAELPLATRIIIQVADVLTEGLPIVIPTVIVVFYLLRSALTTDKGRMFRDRLKLKSPFFGTLFLDYALSSFCRTLGTTLLSGIPIVQALQMSKGTLDNSVFEDKMSIVIKRVQEGVSLSDALEQTMFFPGLALRMIGVGETSSSLSEMLSDVADYYEDEVERRLDRLSTLIEPVLMLAMGLLVGAIVVAMYLPIFQMGATVH
jgi:type IV pilus assembly protein PilC